MKDITIAVLDDGFRYIAPGPKALAALRERFGGRISDMRSGLSYDQIALYEASYVAGKWLLFKIHDDPESHDNFYTSCVVEGILTGIGRDINSFHEFDAGRLRVISDA